MSSPGDRRCRLHFHLALAGIFLPCISLPLIWGLALYNRLASKLSPEGRKWATRLTVLALFDTLLIICLILQSSALDAGLIDLPELREPPRARAGLILEPETAPPTVAYVAPGLPADRAGVRVGDVIVELDGNPTGSARRLTETLARGEPGGARSLKIRRGKAPLTLEIVPERVQQPKDVSLFEIIPREEPRTLPFGFWALLASVLLLGGGCAAWAAHRHAPRILIWRGYFLAVALFLGFGYAFELAAEEVLGGRSVGAALIGWMISIGSILIVALALLRWSPLELRHVRAAPPPLSVQQAFWKGAYYTITCYVRIAIFFWFLHVVLLEGRFGGSNDVAALMGTNLGPIGWTLLVLLVVFIGPTAEELLYRGFLLPRLSAQLGDHAALWITSIAFAITHWSYEIYMVPIVVYGLTFGWVRLRCGRVGPCIALHMLVNAIVTGAYILMR